MSCLLLPLIGSPRACHPDHRVRKTRGRRARRRCRGAARSRSRRGEVTVEFSPLNKHDLLLASGALLRPPLPLFLGNEGVARISEVGLGVGTVAVGDLVVVPLFAGAWRERLLLPAEGLFRLPEGSTEQFSMLGSNPPTAGLILGEYADLEPGDWIVQNAANSGVGRSLIALAKARGFQTINLARNESVFAELTASGADIVHLDNATAAEDVRKEIGDARVALAVDPVGGASAGRLLDLLSEGGSLVAYATATGQPMPVNELTLISKRATVRGFLAGHYDYDDIDAAIRQLERGGKVLLKVARS